MSDWAFDLAFFHNLVYNAAAGRGFTQSASLHELDGLLNLSHAFFLLPLLVPFYALVPRLETLLVLQAFALASGAYPVARLARSGGATRFVAFGAAALYLSAFPLWRLGLADFRELMFAVPALLWLTAGLIERSPRLALPAALAACLVREELPLLVIALAVTLGVARRTGRSTALFATALAIGWFALLLIARPRMGYYIPFDRPAMLLNTLHLEPVERAVRMRQLSHLASFFPPGFLPALLDPLLLAGSLPLLAYQLQSSAYEWWRWDGPYIHHCAPLLAFSAAAAALGWGRLETLLRRRSNRGAVLTGALLGLALALQVLSTWHQVSGAMGWLDGANELEARKARQQALEPLLARIPPTGRVATDYRWIARLSGRPQVYCYQTGFDPPAGQLPPSKRTGLDQVDWMLIDATHETWVRRLDHAPDWRLEASGGGYNLYSRVTIEHLGPATSPPRASSSSPSPP
jgi:uncharacterized membrane protein